MNTDKLVIDFEKVFQTCMTVYNDGQDAINQYKALHNEISNLNKNCLLVNKQESIEKNNPLDDIELVVDPAVALSNTKSVTCCICGKEFYKLTESHMALSHGITLDDYRDLCGYDESTKLFR